MGLKWIDRFAWIAGVPLLAFTLSAAGISGAWNKQASPEQSQGQSPKAIPKTGASAQSGSATKRKIIPRNEYVGDAVCGQCHSDKFDTYEKTAHHLTSQTVNKDTIVGNFNSGSNTMATANPNLTFRMDVRGDGFYQTAIWGPPTDPSSAAGNGTRTRTERLDLVIGSGGKGQTYLYWRDNQLFQLPVGYSTVLQQWINSPGYTDGTANFERSIIPRCLECHATYFESVFPDPELNMYDAKNFVLGISCERCHGPGRGHAEKYKSTSSVHAAGTIVNPTKLSPARQADVCGQCHGGQGERFLLPAFSYVPGQPLEKYIDLGPIDSTKDVDVHGKQGKLMMKSRCYQVSANMSCSTCHDVHKKEPDLAVMSQHCLTCHKVEASATHRKVGEGIVENCIDCHMPTLESKVVALDVNGKKVRPRFRSHWIKIYSEQERK
jgi:hypothetical protein